MVQTSAKRARRKKVTRSYRAAAICGPLYMAVVGNFFEIVNVYYLKSVYLLPKIF